MTKTVIEMDQKDLVRAMREVQSQLLVDNFLSRFNNRLVDSKVACAILDISYPTLVRYVKEGRIIPVRSAEQKAYRFRLAYLLQLDIKKNTHFNPTSHEPHAG